VFLILVLLYRHACARRDALQLNELERFDTRAEVLRYLLLAGVGLLSIAVALVVDRRVAGLAGFVYFLVGVVEGVHGSVMGKRRRELRARLGESTAAATP
jgi:hypothetical protein